MSLFSLLWLTALKAQQSPGFTYSIVHSSTFSSMKRNWERNSFHFAFVLYFRADCSLVSLTLIHLGCLYTLPIFSFSISKPNFHWRFFYDLFLRLERKAFSRLRSQNFLELSLAQDWFRARNPPALHFGFYIVIYQVWLLFTVYSFIGRRQKTISIIPHNILRFGTLALFTRLSLPSSQLFSNMLAKTDFTQAFIQ